MRDLHLARRGESVPLGIRAIRWQIRALYALSERRAIDAASARFRSPIRVALTPRMRVWYSTGDTEVIRAGGFDVSVYSRGDGPLALVVHGWNSLGYHMHDIADDLVARGYRVFVPDWPCMGRSGGELIDQVQAIRAMQDLIRQIEKRGAPVEHIVAHSWGGTVTVGALNGEPLAAPDELPIAPSLRSLTCISMPTTYSDISGLFKLALKLPDAVAGGMDRQMVKIASEAGTTVEAVFPMGCDALLSSPRMPVLLVHDAEDTSVSPHSSEELAQLYGALNLHRTAGLGHTRILKDGGVQELVAAHMANAAHATVARRAGWCF
jgi:pimeloyl-ACP methyl ester carboxylesterase